MQVKLRTSSTPLRPLPAFLKLNVPCNAVELLLYQTVDQYTVSRTLPLFLAEQVFTDITPCRLVSLATNEDKLRGGNAQFGVSDGAFQQMGGSTAVDAFTPSKIST